MKDREIVINFDPNMNEHRYEQSVVYIFSKYHEKIGFPTVLNIKPSFPDATAINDKGERIEIEFEYRSTGFLEHIDRIEEGRKYGMGSTMSIFFLAMSIGQAVGPIISGGIADWLDINSVFYFGAGIGLTGTVLFLWYTRKYHGRPPTRS